jgi:hypothetical protein
MSKVVQVILSDSEFQEITKSVQSQNLSITEWMRVVLGLSHQHESAIEIGRKLAVNRAAAQYDYPTGDLVCVLSEIERGYGNRSQP